MATNLYRHFDAEGRLLYVGISKNAVCRLGGHKNGSCWFAQIASMTIEHFSRRRDAERAERAAIREENPAHNQTRYRRKKPKRPQKAVAAKRQPKPNPDRDYRPQFGPGGDHAVIAGHYSRLITDADIAAHKIRWGLLNEVKGSNLPPMKSSNSLTNWRKDGFKGWTPPTETTDEE